MAEKMKKKPVRILLLAGDLYGANCTSNEKKLSILDKFRSFGWEATLAGVDRVVRPCAFAAERGAVPLPLDLTVDEVGDVTAYDAVSVLPGPAHAGLIASRKAMQLLRQASEAGLVVSGWCHGVRALAAADVIAGKQVVGHARDREAIEQAGGLFVGHDHPPVIDGRLVTGARCYHYRAKNAEAIRAAIEARAASA